MVGVGCSSILVSGLHGCLEICGLVKCTPRALVDLKHIADSSYIPSLIQKPIPSFV